MLRRQNIRLALGMTFAQLGLDVAKILKPVLEGLEATKAMYIKEGGQVTTKIVPDLAIRLKAASLGKSMLEWESEHTQDLLSSMNPR